MNTSDTFLAEMIGAQTISTARDVSNLVACHDLVDICHFVDLAVATLRVLPDHERTTLRLDAGHPDGGPARAAGWDLPSDLKREWADWPYRYRELVSRNPRLELADRVDQLLDAIDERRWPDPKDRETMLKGWAEAGVRPTMPWRSWSDDDRLTDTFNAVVRLRRITHGWVFCDEVAEARVFVPDWTWMELDAHA